MLLELDKALIHANEAGQNLNKRLVMELDETLLNANGAGLNAN